MIGSEGTLALIREATLAVKRALDPDGISKPGKGAAAVVSGRA
jgi:FAD/FMN-containing dehydrogenase